MLKYFHPIIKKLFFIGVTVLIVFLMMVFRVDYYIHKTTKSQILTIDTLKGNYEIVIVPGSHVYENGQLSASFQDRLQTALELYKLGKVKKILVSGDNSRKKYDEVRAGAYYLLKNGVATGNLFLDFAGFDTYDTMRRAKKLFLVTGQVLVTSQKKFLPRTLYLASAMQIDTYGIISDKHIYFSQTLSSIREKLANLKAIFEVTFDIDPYFKGQKIPISGSGNALWDL